MQMESTEKVTRMNVVDIDIFSELFRGTERTESTERTLNIVLLTNI